MKPASNPGAWRRANSSKGERALGLPAERVKVKARTVLRVSDEKLVSSSTQAQADMAALGRAELLHVNLNINVAVPAVLGLLPALAVMRDQLAMLSEFDLASFDKLEDYALALSAAHTSYLMAVPQRTDERANGERAAELRALLWTDASALALHGLIPEAELSALNGRTGYKNIAEDLLRLSGALRENWPTIAGKCALSKAHLRTARALAKQLLKHARTPTRSRGRVMAAELENRDRAFTLFIRTYEAARGAIHYLRRAQGDADVFAPSLYRGRQQRLARKQSKPRATDKTVNQGPQP